MIVEEFDRFRKKKRYKISVVSFKLRKNCPGLALLCITCVLSLIDINFHKEWHPYLGCYSRLKHHGRIQYTLFLKEIGMPFEEAVKFWQQEYSKPEGVHIHDRNSCKNGSTHNHVACGHSWQLNSKKYLSSLNGLYGRSGSRIDYSAHSCSSLQRALLSSSSDVGGCAFVHSDEPSLKKYFVDVDSVGEDALTPSDLVSPSVACQNCLSERLTLTDVEDVVFDAKKRRRNNDGAHERACSRFSKPSQFYALVRTNGDIC